MSSFTQLTSLEILLSAGLRSFRAALLLAYALVLYGIRQEDCNSQGLSRAQL